MILYLQHIDIEGPDTLGEYFSKKGFKSKIIEVYRGQPFPVSVDGIDAVVCFGGPMNVDEEEKFPFLKSENEFIQKAVKAGVPYLGLCLGSQLLAKACGASVIKSPLKEIGFSSVQLTLDGKKDPLLKGAAENFTVYQWHEDMWNLPDGARLLATASGCPHQAFRVGACAYGVQFHIEITDKSIRDWCDAYFTDPQVLHEQRSRQLADYARVKKSFNAAAELIYDNFLNLITSPTHQK